VIDAWSRTAAGPLVGGHRGAAARAPENTLAGFRLAIDASVDYLELDVHLARDGVLVVIHDDDLERTTDGSGRVADAPSEELQGLDAGAWMGPAWAGESVPRLAQVLDLLAAARTPGGGRVGAVVEAKGDGTGGPLARVLAAAPGRDRLAICSFSPSELQAARAAAPDLPTMLIVDRDRPGDDPVRLAHACGAAMVNVPAAWLSRGDVDRLHRAGLLVAGGTCDDEAAMRHAVAIGLDAVDSNVPDLAVAWRTAVGARPARA
jgi:glycerophosphoryl diester phosphodiesterase